MRYTMIFLALILSSSIGRAQTVSAKELKTQDLYIRAHQSMLLGDYEDAIEAYESLLAEDPANASASHDLARIYLAQDDMDQAIKAAQRATRLAPDVIWYGHTLADIYRSSGDYDSEAKQLRRIIEMRRDERLYEKWVTALLAAEQYDAAIRGYAEMMGIFGMRESWVDTSIDLYLARNDEKGAESLLRKYADSTPHRIDRRTKLGEFYMFRQKYKKAQRIFDSILEEDPNSEKALFNKKILDNRRRGSDDPILAITSDPTMSLDERLIRLAPLVSALSADPSLKAPLESGIRDLLELSPTNAKLHAIMGDIDYMTDDVENAIAHYDEALSIDPSIYSVWSHLLTCMEMSADYQRLADRSAQAIDYYPNIAEPYYYYALAQWRLGDSEEAHEYLQEAELIGTDDGELSERITILSAQMLYASDRMAAIQLLIDHQSEQGISARLSELIGDLYRQNGDNAKAQEYWQQAIDLGADKDRITAKIASL